MNFKMTNEEIQAFYNELESMRVEKYRGILSEIRRRRGYFSDKEIIKEYAISSQILEWLKGEIHFSSISEFDRRVAVDFIYPESVEDLNEKYIDVIVTFLKATEVTQYVEIAKKLDMIRPNYNYERYERDFAEFVLLHSYGDKAVTNEEKFNYTTAKRRKTVTTKTEYKEIKRRSKSARKKDIKNKQKYKNIYNLYKDNDEIYTAIIKFMSKYGRRYSINNERDRETYFYNLDKVRELVLEHQFEAMDMLDDLACLDVFRSQRTGKIR